VTDSSNKEERAEAVLSDYRIYINLLLLLLLAWSILSLAILKVRYECPPFRGPNLFAIT